MAQRTATSHVLLSSFSYQHRLRDVHARRLGPALAGLRLHARGHWLGAPRLRSASAAKRGTAGIVGADAISTAVRLKKQSYRLPSVRRHQCNDDFFAKHRRYWPHGYGRWSLTLTPKTGPAGLAKVRQNTSAPSGAFANAKTLIADIIGKMGVHENTL